MLLTLAWAAAIALHYGLGIWAFLRQRSRPGSVRRHAVALVVSGIGSVMPLVSLLFVVRVFLLGGGSNVAQYNDPNDLSLFVLWGHAWFVLYPGCYLSAPVSLAGLLTDPRPDKRPVSFAARLLGLGVVGLALHFLRQYSPRA